MSENIQTANQSLDKSVAQEDINSLLVFVSQHNEDETEFLKKFEEIPETLEKDSKFLINKEEYLELATKFAMCGISPNFIMQYVQGPKKAIDEFFKNDFDLQKDGIDVFTSKEGKKAYIDFIIDSWDNNNSEQYKANLLALSENIGLRDSGEKVTRKLPGVKGLSDKEQIFEDDENNSSLISNLELNENYFLKKYFSNKLRECLRFKFFSADFGAIISIEDSVFNLKESLAKADLQESSYLPTHIKIIEYVKYLGGHIDHDLFPKSFSKIREIIFDLLDSDIDLADYFIENLDKYYKEPWVEKFVKKAIKHYSVANKFTLYVKNTGLKQLWKDEPWVSSVSEIIADNEAKIAEEADSYLQGFSETDKYEEHPWKFTTEQARRSVVLEKILEGAIDEEEYLNFGIETEVIKQFIKNINKLINEEITSDYVFRNIKNNHNISEDDKAVFIESKYGTVEFKPLVSIVRGFVARYMVQKFGDFAVLNDEDKLSSYLDDVADYNKMLESVEFSIEELIRDGLKKFIKALEVDVPLYDKLYEEFDSLRETGRSPLEVYLGRDGIYAYLGRRAQDVSRRRKMGLAGRTKLKEMGEIIEIHPQYTVFPRYFRDNLDYKTKREFLEQEGISPDADPLFYDTGYIGTVPEQIMKIMDFDNDDIEKRIRLLSAPHPRRRVKGISENARSEIVEYIEHNSKTEEAAEGLIKDPKTGRIRPVAKPTSPEEQFNFMMVKQAIGRHYWLKEKLHHEPSGNINLDSEHYAIRIRQDYAKYLPKEFLDNPKTFFTEHGELLKGSRGEGEYPDEEVILFKLVDGTEIVAKKIELRKAKEARKEFSILISAKKAGLPTAEPVGFLSGKEESDGSYLLMKKIEGRSGRKFEKELRQSGKYTEERITEIMAVVAEKNREMAELFKTTLKIDKNWKIKDTIIEFNEETGEVGSVIPIDWERAKDYNPNSPQEIN